MNRGEDAAKIDELYKNIISMDLHDNAICCKLENIHKRHINILRNGTQIKDIHIQERCIGD